MVIYSAYIVSGANKENIYEGLELLDIFNFSDVPTTKRKTNTLIKVILDGVFGTDKSYTFDLFKKNTSGRIQGSIFLLHSPPSKKKKK